MVDIARGNLLARDWVDSLSADARFISFVTAAELFAGCQNKRQEELLERELEFYNIVWADEFVSETALDLYRRWHLSHGIGFLDCLLAATALVKKFSFATLNLKHFKPIAELVAERPY